MGQMARSADPHAWAEMSLVMLATVRSTQTRYGEKVMTNILLSLIAGLFAIHFFFSHTDFESAEGILSQILLAVAMVLAATFVAFGIAYLLSPFVP